MPGASPRFVGAELFLDDLASAKRFYERVLGLELSDEAPGHYAQFASGTGFVCLERKGSESYPSQDKAVLFFEVASLHDAIELVGRERIVAGELEARDGRRAWTVLHDPEGHNVLLLEPDST
jgi:predicted enzyme related to lactoylglutathione lyase